MNDTAMMLSKAQQFCAVKPRLIHFLKFYCSDKFENLHKTGLAKDKKTELLREPPDIIAESYEECAKFEEDVLKQVLIEKEKDASSRSRLLKECKTLFSTGTGRLRPGTCGPLHLDQISLQVPNYPDWDTYSLDSSPNKSSKQSPTANTSNPTNPTNLSVTPGSKTEEILLNKGGPGGISGGKEVTTATRPIRQEPGKVIFAFIPEEWWRNFIPKTGVTGFGTFLFSFSTYLVSKEFYVLEHYYYQGLGILGIWFGGIKYVGPLVAKWLDKELDQYEKSWNVGREYEKQSLEDVVVHELLLQFQSEGQLILLDAKRENIQLQLEEEFRKRQMVVYSTVKQRLDYHLALEIVKQRIQQKNLVEYVTREVQKSITPEMQNKLIYYSIDKIVDDLGKGGKK